MSLKPDRNPSESLHKYIDYTNSLHTKQIQRSNFIKFDDNLLQFDFDKNFGIGGNPNLQRLTEE